MTNWAYSITFLSLRTRLRCLLGDVLALIAFTAVLALLWFFGVGS